MCTHARLLLLVLCIYLKAARAASVRGDRITLETMLHKDVAAWMLAKDAKLKVSAQNNSVKASNFGGGGGGGKGGVGFGDGADAAGGGAAAAGGGAAAAAAGGGGGGNIHAAGPPVVIVQR